MKTYDIAVIPGDGIGKEVTDEGLKILQTVADIYDFKVKIDIFDWGCDYYLQHGEMMPGSALDTLRDVDAIFLGCVGDADKVPDNISLKMLLAIRKTFDQYINLRPIKLYPGVDTPIRSATPETVDLVVVRENTEGEYSALGGFFKQGEADAFALQTSVFTQKGCERVIRYAFELSRRRNKSSTGKQSGMVTNCTKSNALNYSMVFWDNVYTQVASDYPEINTDAALVDAMTMWLVKKPSYFDVIVASNLFGDIITDLGAMLQGGMGFAAGANLNPEKAYPSMFEPIHGSAPKYQDKGVANPVASIEAIRMMLSHLGETRGARHIERAISRVLTRGEVKTRDMGGDHHTKDLGDAIQKTMLTLNLDD